MAFDSMSPQAKMGAAGGGCAALGSASYLLYRVASPQLLYYISIGTLLLAVLMGGFYWLVQKYRQRKAKVSPLWSQLVHAVPQRRYERVSGQPRL